MLDICSTWINASKFTIFWGITHGKQKSLWGFSFFQKYENFEKF